MTVPTTSAGSRSGVNWMRENSAATVLQMVLTVSVLARPGTPSSSTWPPVSKPMSTRWTISSWPTMTFLTSWRSASVKALSRWTMSLMARTSILMESP